MKRAILLIVLWMAATVGMTTKVVAQDIRLNVSRVIDGDTFEGRLDNDGNPGVNPWAIELTRIIIRISGIDAPERGQYYGDVATLHLHWLISGKAVGLKLKRGRMVVVFGAMTEPFPLGNGEG